MWYFAWSPYILCRWIGSLNYENGTTYLVRSPYRWYLCELTVPVLVSSRSGAIRNREVKTPERINFFHSIEFFEVNISTKWKWNVLTLKVQLNVGLIFELQILKFKLCKKFKDMTEIRKLFQRIYFQTEKKSCQDIDPHQPSVIR